MKKRCRGSVRDQGMLCITHSSCAADTVHFNCAPYYSTSTDVIRC
jgi:hypothetical protein